MFFPEDEPEVKSSDPEKTVFIYENGGGEGKPFEFKIYRKKENYKDLKKALGLPHLRLYNSEGAEYFQDDLEFVKNNSVLYASNGEDFDTASCFGEYSMQNKLGEGGFGQVWLAHHRQTDEKVAIKIIRTERVGSAANIDGIFVQAQTLKSLKHQNIVRVQNCLTLRNMKVAIIMEYLQGGQLLGFVQKQGKLDQPTARILIKQVVKAMTYCHSNGLIHRDLKLQNLLLVNREELKIKVIDFGIAGVMKSMTWEDLDIGSLAYMAPECFVNSKGYQVDGRIDVWAIGVIIYSMLFGELPFTGSSRQEAIEAIKKGIYKLPKSITSNLSEECINAMKQCLAVDPKERVTMEQLHSHPWISGQLFQAHNQTEEQIMLKNKKIEEERTKFLEEKPEQKIPNSLPKQESPTQTS